MRDDDQHVLRLIAFYLPQFHPIPENDAWWGPGFTEWRNVVRARPLFPGHHQPQLPADLGFYDLRVPEVREAQAEMAEAYGISGFCYYHYWFNGRQLLNRPFDEVLHTGRPRFKFCLCWANESWTRRWDGMHGELLMQQQYSAEDDRAHIDHLLPAFADDRYIKIGGRPIFLVYRSHLLPDPARTADLWRERARAAGFADLYLIRVAGYGREVDPQTIGFDAVVEFAPDWTFLPPRLYWTEKWGLTARINNQLQKAGLMSTAYRNHNVFSYAALAAQMRSRPKAPFQRFRCITPGWDNSPRRRQDALIFHGTTPEHYEAWLRILAQDTLATFQGDERILFVNAWNEWAEGNHLEPDQRWGRAYLEATARALFDACKRTAQG
jgi:lipopolysaccharide biosynthesis protein